MNDPGRIIAQGLGAVELLTFPSLLQSWVCSLAELSLFLPLALCPQYSSLFHVTRTWTSQWVPSGRSLVLALTSR